jgi:hypothetical protein
VGRSNSKRSSAALMACLKQELELLQYWDDHYSANPQTQMQIDARKFRAQRRREILGQIASLEQRSH